MILDKLIERKDLKIYIDYRIKHLLKVLRKDLEIAPLAHRESLKRNLSARIEELKTLRGIVSNKRIREYGKRYWREAVKHE